MGQPDSLAAYQKLAEFLYQIRHFLHIAEDAARAHGIGPQQRQLMLAIKGLPEGERPAITTLASKLCLKHHSVVELVNRLAERGVIARRRSTEDRPEVVVEMTPLGDEILGKLAGAHLQELNMSCPELCRILQAIVDGASVDEVQASSEAVSAPIGMIETKTACSN